MKHKSETILATVVGCIFFANIILGVMLFNIPAVLGWLAALIMLMAAYKERVKNINNSK